MKVITKWMLICFSVLVFNQQVSAMAVFDEIVIFGDSLSDSGAFVGNADAGGGGKFTTNPGLVWTEVLGQNYGLAVVSNNPNNPNTSPTGNNYAQGGAQVTSPIGIGQSASPQSALSISTQVSNYLTGSPAANSNGLYTILGGANDVFFNAAQVGGGLLITTAIDNMVTSAFSMVEQVQRLSAAGAGTILVSNLPDIGTTPAVILQSISAVGAGNTQLQTALGAATLVLRTPGNSPAEQAAVQSAAIAAAEAQLGVPAGTLAPVIAQTAGLFTALTTAYNTTLGALLATSPENVIQLDLAKFFEDALFDPAAYGFDNVTGTACNTASSLTCSEAFYASADADKTFLFADSVHPTTAGHLAVANFAISTVNAATSVPEPGILFLLGPVFGFLAFRKRKVA